MSRRANLPGLSATLVLVTAAACSVGSEPARRPNVLLVSVDTLRPDHLGCYGYERDTSPAIDRLAREGVLFEQHVSSTSWTLPAHASLFTSLADTVHGCTDTDRRLDERLTTLAERFAAQGYATFGIYSGPFLHPSFGLAQGFEHYVDCVSYSSLIGEAEPEEWATASDVIQRSQEEITSPRVLEAFRDRLARRDARPFFAFVHLWDVHYDFVPPPPYDTRFDPDYSGPVDGRRFFFDPSIHAGMPARDLEHLIALYDGEIAWTDLHLGRMLEALRELGLEDDTVVALTADHGTEFFEHGGKGHRTTLFDEVILVPLVLRFPAGLPAGARVRAQSRAIDVGPTLLELAGLAAPEGVMGRSLVALAQAADAGSGEPAVSELFSVGRRMRTLRTGEWKLFDLQHAGARGFVDLRADPAETKLSTDLAGEPGQAHLRLYEASVGELDAWRARIDAGAAASQVPDAVRRQLDALGYTGD